MQIQLTAPQIWLATEAVDFRKSINGLNALVTGQFQRTLNNHIYIFFNRAKNRLKLLAYHRNGHLMIYKSLDKKKFTIKQTSATLFEITPQQLSWLLAGLDWIQMSEFSDETYDDYF